MSFGVTGIMYNIIDLVSLICDDYHGRSNGVIPCHDKTVNEYMPRFKYSADEDMVTISLKDGY